MSATFLLSQALPAAGDLLGLADDRLRTAVDGDLLTGAKPGAGWWHDTSRDVARIAGTVARALSPAMMVETRACAAGRPVAGGAAWGCANRVAR